MAGLNDIGKKDESSHNYLASLCIDAAMGIDFIMRDEKSKHTEYVKELAELIDKYGKKCTSETIFCWPYLTLWRAFMQDKKKEIRTVSELSLEMRLFANDLFDAQNLPQEKQKELLHFCCLASQYFMADSPDLKKYLAA